MSTRILSRLFLFLRWSTQPFVLNQQLPENRQVWFRKPQAQPSKRSSLKRWERDVAADNDEVQTFKAIMFWAATPTIRMRYEGRNGRVLICKWFFFRRLNALGARGGEGPFCVESVAGFQFTWGLAFAWKVRKHAQVHGIGICYLNCAVLKGFSIPRTDIDLAKYGVEFWSDQNSGFWGHLGSMSSLKWLQVQQYSFEFYTWHFWVFCGLA